MRRSWVAHLLTSFRRTTGLLHYFYALEVIHFSSFMDGSLILLPTMTKLCLNLRGASLTVLILAAIGHADLQTTHTTLAPHISGLGRLGRDLGRRAASEEIMLARNAEFHGVLPSISREPRAAG
jgi:hypothetical protein